MTSMRSLPRPTLGDYDPQNEAQFRREVESVLTQLSSTISSDPAVSAISATFYKDGSAKVTVTGNKFTKSIKCAISTAAYPSTATVNAATATDGSSADFSFTGPYALGDTVYLSALAYSGAGGSGNASEKKDVKVVVSVIQSTLLVTLTQTASTGFSDPSSSVYPTVTLTMVVTDPAGLLTGNALCTIDYNGIQALYNNTLAAPAVTFNATIGTTYTFTATLNKALKGGGYARFTATKSGGYGGSSTWWASSAWADAPADVIITILSNTAGYVTAKASLTVNTADNVDSMKWLASTSSQPSKASTVATGALVSVGPPFSVSDLGVDLALGDTVYVTIVGYDYDGVLMDKVFYAKATRTKLAFSKTITLAAVRFVTTGFQTGAIKPVTSTGEVYLDTTSLDWGPAEIGGEIILPYNVEITDVGAEIWQEVYSAHPADSRVYFTFYAPPSAFATLSSTTASASWQSLTASCSQTTTGKRILVSILLAEISTGLSGKERVRSISVTYTPTDQQATI